MLRRGRCAIGAHATAVRVFVHAFGGLLPGGREKFGLCLFGRVCGCSRGRWAHDCLVRQAFVDFRQQWKFALITRIARAVVVINTLKLNKILTNLLAIPQW